MAFQAVFCKYLLFIYLYVWFLLNGGPFRWSLCFSCFYGPLPPFFLPLALFPKLSWLLRSHPWCLPGKSPSVQELPTTCYFLSVTYRLSQNFSAWLSLLLSNRCTAWRKSFLSHTRLSLASSQDGSVLLRSSFPPSREWLVNSRPRTLQS